jgi:hypothetical protein
MRETALIVGPHGSAGNFGSHDETVTPVTIIPTADLVREAARVLYQRFPDDHPAFNEMGASIRDGVGAGDAFSAALRSLAIAEGENWPARDAVKEAARVLLGAMFEPDGTTYNGDFLGKLPAAPIHNIEASLRALAGQGGE